MEPLFPNGVILPMSDHDSSPLMAITQGLHREIESVFGKAVVAIMLCTNDIYQVGAMHGESERSAIVRLKDGNFEISLMEVGPLGEQSHKEIIISYAEPQSIDETIKTLKAWLTPKWKTFGRR